MPTVEDIMSKLTGFSYFPPLDLMSGYYKIPVHRESLKFATFVTNNGPYAFLRMPFGLVNAHKVIQSVMNEVAKMLRAGEIMAYLDDTKIPSTKKFTWQKQKRWRNSSHRRISVRCAISGINRILGL